jgi:hypothetical protein
MSDTRDKPLSSFVPNLPYDPLEPLRAYADCLRRGLSRGDEAERGLEQAVSQTRQRINSAISEEWLAPRLQAFSEACNEALDGRPSREVSLRKAESALEELTPAAKGQIEWDPDRVRLHGVLHAAKALREALRPCLTEGNVREQEHNASVWLKLLRFELNPDAIPREQQGGYRGPPVVRRTLTDLRSVCYDLTGPRSQGQDERLLLKMLRSATRRLERHLENHPEASALAVATPAPSHADIVPPSALAPDVNRLGGEGAVSPPGSMVGGQLEHVSRDIEFGGWEILHDAPAEQVGKLPPPAEGRLVIALDPPTIHEFDEMQRERRYVFRREHLALLWRNGRGEEVLHALDHAGCLLRGCQQDATWLPGGWEMDVFPTGWALGHLQAWFQYAISIARMDDRGDIPPGSERSPSYAPTPRGLVTHAHLIVRHLGLPASPTEPRGPMAGCLAELRDVFGFFRRALQSAEPPTEPPTDKPERSRTPPDPQDVPSVQLRGRDEAPLVLGREKPQLSEGEYNVIEALLDAGDRGLSKDKLDEKSGHTEARKFLTRLRNSDPDWAAVIRLPGRPGRGGYRIK